MGREEEVMRHKTIPCRHIFSNGTEFELFAESQCYNGCVYYRNEHCRILKRICEAMWDESVFPFDDLWEFEGIGGKACKRFTTEAIKKQKNHDLQKQRGQITFTEVE